MESGDASDKETPPCDPKSNDPMKIEWSNVISMVVDMETEDGLKRGAVMVITKKTGLACADLLDYRTNNIHFLLCTSMVLIYNSFFAQTNSRRSVIYSTVFILIFYFGNLFLFNCFI